MTPRDWRSGQVSGEDVVMLRAARWTRRAALWAVTGTAAATLLLAPASAGAASSASAGSPASDIRSVPVRPKRCTDKQLAAVTIDRCTVFAEGSPADHGFARPPFPTDQIVTSPVDAARWRRVSVGASGTSVIVLQERLHELYPEVLVLGRFGSQTKSAVQRFQRENALVDTGSVDAQTAAALGVLVSAQLPSFPPKGWRWNGSHFGGSDALDAWEKRLTDGVVRGDPIAAPLIEGFLADLHRGNYRIDEAGTYSFRCTASTVRNCKGQGIAHLSYHAWGLAVDLNYSTNSLQTADDPTDACSAQVQHAVPNWVLAAAMHWGLYWGGWYSCSGSSALSAVRDPHHFEYRGTPELAQAILAKNTGTIPGKKAAKATVPKIAELFLACGDAGDSVVRLRKLLPRSYRPREASIQNEVFTPRLTTALARWQRDRGLPITGALDPQTAEALGVTVKHREVFPVLHLHSCGEAVRVLQNALGIEATGTFDAATMVALRNWQSAHGLGPTGVVDTATAAAIGLEVGDFAGEPNLELPATEVLRRPRIQALGAPVGALRGTNRPDLHRR